jgi:hypothetical protein
MQIKHSLRRQRYSMMWRKGKMTFSDMYKKELPQAAPSTLLFIKLGQRG